MDPARPPGTRREDVFSIDTPPLCPASGRVQNHFGVRCDPSLPYDPDFTPPERPGRHPVPVSRRTFVELCDRPTAEEEKEYARVWRRVGLSVDWGRAYRTIDATPGPPRSGRSCGTWRAARPTAPGPDPVGHHVPHRRRTGGAGGA